ncbi:hypothetical protein [Pseudoduganella umbonata]|uniref:Uncharacterized protein n=1 Tax=Pseudoduganella umbonata TaxID=864828 RepID=A0A4P8HY14_9BURK|nr:hypothetical protein [Pseudoduganella umbonata]MBB3224605.1 hypothetical protein [Pseudoduganella umbonata]QCP13365.1 hypothetical protein FCL38_25215 [Pseudoduganella umbonata]
MTLPGLALQIAYGHVAWALVLLALLLACMPGLARRHGRALAAGFVVLCALPGAWSPSWWLTLAFQYPSGLLVGLSLMSLERRRQGAKPRPVLPLAMALPLALAGAILYLDTFGVLALGLYHGGFGTVGAPLLGFAAIAACAFAIWRGHALQPALALLTGLLLYALLRLPTGNLWDALLDPLLWMWALGSAVAAGVRQAAGARAPAVQPQPAPVPVPVLAAEPVPVAGQQSNNFKR